MFIELLYLLRGHNIANVNVTLVGPHIDSKLASSSATLPVDGDLPGLSIRFVDWYADRRCMRNGGCCCLR